jgi:uncharacterized protein YndB with AHSA1/START domain
MEITDMNGAATLHLPQPPETVYAFITDIAAMARLSPECYSAQWAEGLREPRVGATFIGHNRANGFEWSTVCEVVAAEPHLRFGFDAGLGERRHTRWMFDIVAEGSGSVVTESFQFLALPPFLAGQSDSELAARTRQLRDGLVTTLDNLQQRLT